MTIKTIPIETIAETPMDRICSILQLTGMVWKRGSLLNNFLVLLSSLVLACLTLGCNVVWMIKDDSKGYSLGFAMLLNSYLTIIGLYAVIGSFTLGGLLEASLPLKLKLPIINAAVWIIAIATVITVASSAWLIVEEDGHYYTIIYTFLYLVIIGTHLKTVLIAGSVMTTFKDEYELLADSRKFVEDYQCSITSFKLLKQKSASLFLWTFGTLTCIMIFGSYDAYVVFTCGPGTSASYIALDFALFVSNAGMLLYLSQLAEDTYQSFNSIQEPLR